MNDLKSFLDEKAEQYNHPNFVLGDPIQMLHRFELKQDIEIIGFLTATIAWGNRKSIIKSAEKMLMTMGNSPYDFVMNFKEKDFEKMENKAIHRTFSLEDFQFFQEGETNFYHALERFRNTFFENDFQHRSQKHISSTYKNSAAKRLMMYLRWMVRKDNKGVDLGIWENIGQEYLSVPLDVHVGNISRKLGLIQRTQNDWKSVPLDVHVGNISRKLRLIQRTQNDWKTVEELDFQLRKMDEKDPAKYDFALFGLGISGEL